MKLPPPVARLRTAWNARAGRAREQAAFAVFLAVLVGGAHLARLGTGLARGATTLLLALALVAQGLVFVVRRREEASVERTVRQILSATDPALSASAQRALRLVERSAKDPSAGEPELAEAHFRRLLEKVTSDAVRTASGRVAERFRALTVALVSLATIAVVVGPQHVVEGLDVLAARHGRAPVPMSWLGYPRLSAQPPAYTRESERSIALGTSVEVPKGTLIVFRGVPLSKGRELCLTDGKREEPFSNDGAGGLVSRWTVTSNVSLRVAARFGDVRIDDEESVEVSSLPDASPRVRVQGAPKTVSLAQVDRIDVQWTAEDDHGLREVDLVLRSGAREDRRVLSRFDGESRVEHGGRVVSARDAFLRRAFLPVTLVVEAKDNDPLDGPKWSRSEPIVIEPPDVGEPEALRIAALRGIRDDLVELLAGRMQHVDDERARQASDRALLSALATRAGERLSGTYSGLSVPPGVVAFFDGQLERLRRGKDAESARVAEEALLSVDAAIGAAGAHDSQDVAKRLGDVAEEAASAARAAREKEGNSEAVARLDAALVAIERGSGHLEELGALGQDVGSVARGDAGRIRHAERAKDYFHAELAALHLAERLRRPVPSFGATTGGGGHGGGVEAGHGKGSGGNLPSPSNANEEWKRAEDAVSELSEEHQGALRGVEGALDEASRKEATEAERAEAKRVADSVRRAVDPLPLPGQEFGTPRAAAALAREHGNASAHALDDLSLEDAEESARSGLSALDQAEKQLDPDDPLRGEFAAARRALAEARDFAHRASEKRRAEAEARAQSALKQAGDAEQGLAERAEKLAEEGSGKEANLPKDIKDRLERAGNVMRQAARELSEGHGARGAELQREAQRLLEEAKPERRNDGRAPDDDGDEEGETPDAPDDAEAHDRGPIATGGKVPPPDEKARAEEFRRRVVEGLSKDKSERLSPAVKRYAEGLLR
ncbi:MAG TPA: DUF4175 domain-containing protein [Polyangiaceae bacterium]|nr:DUF4175 domain-containing protein [Polyangiaceae bacterium]